jgi:soluble lytic murein transglycosylase
MPWLTIAQQSWRIIFGEALAMIVFRLAAVAAGLSALFAAGLESGSGPAHTSSTARVVAALSSRLHPAAPAALARAAAAPLVVMARAFVPPGRGLDFTPVGAIKPELPPSATPAAAAPPPSLPVVAAALTPPVPLPDAAPAPPVPLVAAPPPPVPFVAAIPPPPAPLAAATPHGLDGTALAAAAALYRKGDLAGGDALAAKVDDPAERAAFDWLALRLAPHPDDKRLAAFAPAHPHWPGEDWLRAVDEAHLYADHPAASAIAARFAADPPTTPAGKLALARADLEAGRREEATGIVEALWRGSDLDAWGEAATLKDFAPLLTQADHKYRADRMLYAERTGAAMRAAALAGPDEVALAQARIAAMNGPLPQRLIAAVPAALQQDPGLLFARVQDARRANRSLEAAELLRQAPSDTAALIDPDKWWSERRMVARELLDVGQPQKAFELCAAAAPTSVSARIDADFHAGWFALRFLGQPEEGARRFAAAAAIAATPLSIARAAYWQGRAADALGRADEARGFYERAAAFPIAYYGQLAGERLGRRDLALRAPAAVADGAARLEATRVVEWLYAAGLDDIALSLAVAAGGPMERRGTARRAW